MSFNITSRHNRLFKMMWFLVLSGFLVILFGCSNASPEEGLWVSKASMLQPRKDMAAVTLDGKIYVIGGSDRSGGGTERRTSIVDIYDPSTDTWSTGTALPANEYPGTVVVNDKIYVVGDDGRTFSYDAGIDEWIEHAQMPVSAEHFGIGVVDGKIYVTRGSPEYPTGEYWTYCYDPLSDTWTPKTGIPYHRSIESCASLGGKLYAIGGADPSLGSRIEVTRVDIYDPESDSWELDAIPRMSVPRTHLEPNMPVVNCRIYVIGGWNGYSALSVVEEYDPVSNSWRTLTSMPTARYSLATAAVGGKIYAMGGDWGGAGGHLQAVNEEFTPAPPVDLYPLPAGAKHGAPSEPVLDESKLLMDIDLAGQGQTACVSPGERISGSCIYHVWAPDNPNEINQGFLVMSWTIAWPAPEGYYIPIWNGISGLYPGTGEQTESFSLTAPSTPGTYYLYWCGSSHYSMRQAVDTYDQPLTLPAHAKIVVAGYDFLFDERRAGTDTLDHEYSEIAQTLKQQGHTVDSTTDRLTSSLLSKYDILIITCPSGSYTTSELEAIESFVGDGRGLLLMGQWSIGDSTGIGQVAGLFGVSFTGTGAVRDPDLGGADFEPIITEFDSSHPVCTEISSLGIYGGRVLSIGSSTPLAWGDANTYGDLNNNGRYDTGEPMGSDAVVMAATQLGFGRAIFVSDTDLFDNDSLHDHDNQNLFLNIVAWLGETKIELYSLPAGSKSSDPSNLDLDSSKSLKTLDLNGGGQVVTVDPGASVSVSLTYQLWALDNPSELDQLFFIYSWTPTWPPSSDYYHGVYHGMPGLYPGASGPDSFSLTAPSTPGTYYLYWCSSSHYSILQGVAGYDQALSPPGHAKIVVVEEPTNLDHFTCQDSSDANSTRTALFYSTDYMVWEYTLWNTSMAMSQYDVLLMFYGPMGHYATVGPMDLPPGYSSTGVYGGIRIADNPPAENPGSWHVEVYLDGDYKFRDDFTIEESPTREVMIDPNQGKVFVDGEPITTRTTYHWTVGETHTLDPNSGYSPSEGKKLIFDRWNDGNGEDPRVIPVEQSTTYKVYWQTQYRLTLTLAGVSADTLSTTPAPGEYWLNEGITQTLNVPETVYVEADARYRFDHWTINSKDKDGDPIIFTMNGPKIVVIYYAKQFRFQVMSDHGFPEPYVGDHWYNEDVQVTAEVEEYVDQIGGTRLRCTGWTGTGSIPSAGVSTSIVFVIDCPSNITWDWITQYHLTVVSPHGMTDGQGWYDINSTTYATLNAGTVSDELGTRHIFFQWSDDASGNNHAQSNSILMNSPKTSTATWKTQYKLTVLSEHGLPSPSVGTNWYDKGKLVEANVSSPSDESVMTRYRCLGWTGSGSVPLSGSETSTAFIMNTPSSITWNWITQWASAFEFKDSIGSWILDPAPTEINLYGPYESMKVSSPFANVWLDEGKWDITSIIWHGNNVVASPHPELVIFSAQEHTVTCRVYCISFAGAFKDNEGKPLYASPSRFQLLFPNDTISGSLAPSSQYYIQNGTTRWHSVTWQEAEVVPELETFDAKDGNPIVKCRVYMLTVFIFAQNLRPLSDASLELYRDARAHKVPLNGKYGLPSAPVTNALGHFTWHQLASQDNSYSVKATYIEEKKRYRGWLETISLTGNVKEHNALPVQLNPCVNVSCQVIDWSNRSISGAYVQIGENKAECTNEDGWITFADISPGNLTIEVSWMNAKICQETIAASHDFAIPLKTHVWNLELETLDADNTSIITDIYTTFPNGTTRVLAPSTYRVMHGTYSFSVNYLGHWVSANSSVCLDVSDESFSIECSVNDYHFNVHDGDGENVQNANVTLYFLSGGFCSSGLTDSTGWIEFTNLPDSAYIIKTFHKGVQVSNLVEEMTHEDQRRTLDAGIYDIILRCFDTDNDSADEMNVTINDYPVITDTNGYASFANMPNSTFYLNVYKYGVEVASMPIEIEAEGQVFPIQCRLYDLCIKFTDFLGNPLSDLPVEICLPNGELIRRLETNGTGHIRAENLPPLTYTIKTSTWGQLTKHISFLELSYEEQTVDINIDTIYRIPIFMIWITGIGAAVVLLFAIHGIRSRIMFWDLLQRKFLECIGKDSKIRADKAAKIIKEIVRGGKTHPVLLPDIVKAANRLVKKGWIEETKKGSMTWVPVSTRERRWSKKEEEIIRLFHAAHEEKGKALLTVDEIRIKLPQLFREMEEVEETMKELRKFAYRIDIIEEGISYHMPSVDYYYKSLKEEKL